MNQLTIFVTPFYCKFGMQENNQGANCGRRDWRDPALVLKKKRWEEWGTGQLPSFVTFYFFANLLATTRKWIYRSLRRPAFLPSSRLTFMMWWHCAQLSLFHHLFPSTFRCWTCSFPFPPSLYSSNRLLTDDANVSTFSLLFVESERVWMRGNARPNLTFSSLDDDDWRHTRPMQTKSTSALNYILPFFSFRLKQIFRLHRRRLIKMKLLLVRRRTNLWRRVIYSSAWQRCFVSISLLLAFRRTEQCHLTEELQGNPRGQL